MKQVALQSVLKAAADPVNREILNLLKRGSLPAGDISRHFDITQAAISQHLNILKKAGLVTSRREGKYIYYELNATVLEEVLVWIQDLRKGDL